MMMYHVFLRAALGLALSLNACSADLQSNLQTMTPTHVAQINLAPRRYSELVAKLDEEMKALGLNRYGASPGLSELRNREVLYVVYKTMPKEKWAFLDATDIVKHGRIDISIYSQFFADDKIRNDALSRVEKVLGQYGADLKERAHQSH